VSGPAAEPARRPAAERLARIESVFVLLLAAAISLSITASEICFLTALALRLVRWGLGDRPRVISPLLGWSFLGLLLAWLVSGVFAPEMVTSLVRVHRLYLVLVLFLVAEHAGNEVSARRFMWAYLVGASAGALYGLGHWYLRYQALGPTERLQGLMSTGMTSGNLHATAFVAAVAVALAVTGWLRFAAVGAGAVNGAALIATFTRSSWLGAAAGVVALAVSGRRWRVLVFLGVTTALVLAALPPVRERAKAIIIPPSKVDVHDSGRTSSGRISLWLTGLELFAERPITGWGLADHSQLIREHRRADATFEAGHFHSNPVQVAVATGSVGLAAFAFFQVALLVLLWRRRRRSIWAWAAMGVWFNFQIAGLFDWSFGDAEVTYQFFWWMGLGLGNAGPGLVDRDQRS
jgi:O-antigen ligase